MSVNKTILIGYLGQDPVIRTTQGGTQIASISIATSRTWKDKSGEKKEETQWHRVVFYDKLAEIVGQYLKKGSQVYVEGRIEYNEYEKDGVKRYSTNIIADEMRMLGGGQGSQGGQNRVVKPSGDPSPAAQTKLDALQMEDDDIPF